MVTVALLAPSAITELEVAQGAVMVQSLSVGLAVLLIIAYGLGLLFSLKTHAEFFASVDHGEAEEAQWPISLALITLAVVTVLVALVSEIFVESAQQAAETFAISPPSSGSSSSRSSALRLKWRGISAARKNRLDMSVSIAMGSASQIALFVAPVMVLLSYVVGPAPMNMEFWPGAVTMVMIAAVTATFINGISRPDPPVHWLFTVPIDAIFGRRT